MAKKKQTKLELFTGVELGTESVKVLLGAREPEGTMRVLGQGMVQTNPMEEGRAPLSNIRKGNVCQAERVRTFLQRAVGDAEAEAARTTGAEVRVADSRVYVGVSGEETVLREAVGETTVQGEHGLISEDDMVRALRNGLAELHAQEFGDLRPLQQFTRSFQVNGRREVFTVEGLGARTLKASVVCALCHVGNREMVTELVREAVGCDQVGVLYTPLVLSASTLTQEDLARGAINLDIGAGLTNYCANVGSCTLLAGHLPVGCNQLENDLAMAFDVDWWMARRLVRRLRMMEGSSLMHEDDGRSRMCSVRRDTGRRERLVPVSSVEKVAVLRMRVILELVRGELQAGNAWNQVGGDIVLTGGGAMLPGIVELAEDVFERNVRIGRIVNVTDLKCLVDEEPRFAEVCGILCAGGRDASVKDELDPERRMEDMSIKQMFKQAFSAIKEGF